MKMINRLKRLSGEWALRAADRRRRAGCGRCALLKKELIAGVAALRSVEAERDALQARNDAGERENLALRARLGVRDRKVEAEIRRGLEFLHGGRTWGEGDLHRMIDENAALREVLDENAALRAGR